MYLDLYIGFGTKEISLAKQEAQLPKEVIDRNTPEKEFVTKL